MSEFPWDEDGIPRWDMSATIVGGDDIPAIWAKVE
jgi:hypothetical protein